MCHRAIEFRSSPCLKSFTKKRLPLHKAKNFFCLDQQTKKLDFDWIDRKNWIYNCSAIGTALAAVLVSGIPASASFATHSAARNAARSTGWVYYCLLRFCPIHPFSCERQSTSVISYPSPSNQLIPYCSHEPLAIRIRWGPFTSKGDENSTSRVRRPSIDELRKIGPGIPFHFLVKMGREQMGSVPPVLFLFLFGWDGSEQSIESKGC